MELLNYGDRIPEGRYFVHSRFHRAVDFEGDAGLVALVDSSIGGGPINIVVEAVNEAACPATLLVEADRFVFGKQALRKNPERLYNSSVDLKPEDLERFSENLNVLGNCLRHSAPSKSLAFLLDGNPAVHRTSRYERGLSAIMWEGLRHMMECSLAEGARTFRGAGFGLTPSGDDFLAGFLLGLNAAERICEEDLEGVKRTIYENSIGGNPIVNAGLACSREGRVFERLKHLLLALAHSRADDVCINAGKLFDVGETSGADIATGFYVSAVLFIRSGNQRVL